MPPHEKIRVLRIQSRICIGGPALNTINLSAGLNPERYQTLLIGGRLQEDEKSMEPLAHEKGVAIQIIPEMGRSVSLFDDLRAFFKLKALIEKYRPHIVHTHTTKAGALGRLAAFYCKVPIRIHTFHGHVFSGYFNPLINRAVIAAERFLGRLSTQIVAISNIQKRDITEKYKIVKPEKCKVIPLGFELHKVVNGQKGRLKAELGIHPQTRILGILARLVPIKNHSFLLQAIAEWKKIKRERDQAMFLIIGDGTLRSDLEKEARELRITGCTQFTGWRKETAAIYADLDLNLLVSRNEGTPVTLIEGMSAGVPFLSLDVGGIRDIAPEKAGNILPANSTPREFANAIQRFMEQPFELSREIKEEVHRRFDVSRLVRDVEELYKACREKTP
ncbi:MAG: hypothetical protein CSA81_11225 [Acidobacteria bacterium]|nr:MAG: hypothetical protein CSA81_11225 [Acidobacteriota bacterium]